MGRIWGFSLGSGTGVGPMGQTVIDKTQILETAPGVHPYPLAQFHHWLPVMLPESHFAMELVEVFMILLCMDRDTSLI